MLCENPDCVVGRRLRAELNARREGRQTMLLDHRVRKTKAS
jgi:hypothetical protein